MPMIAKPYTALAPAYDLFLGNPMFRRMRDVFEALLRSFPLRFRSAADLGCGTGLFSEYLARRWSTPVFGVDLAPAMLSVAARRCRGLPVRLFRQDMSCLRLPRAVDLAVCNFDAINHLRGPDAVRRMFRRVERHLTPSGHFLFDALTTAQRFVPGADHDWTAQSRRHFLRQTLNWNPSTRILRSTVTIFRPGWLCPLVEHHAERLYPAADILRWLRESGFQIRAVLDSLSLHPVRSAPRIIVLARKRC